MFGDGYKNTAAKGSSAILGKILLGLVVIIILSMTGYFLGWFDEAAKVAQDEFGPEKALAKYEWFINQASAIEKMDQDIALYENRTKNVDERYQGYGANMADWPPHIQVQFNKEKQQADEDLLAVISQRNNLVKEYNAQSEKFNWAPFQTKPDKPVERFHQYMSQ